jgi:hypothetical protein
VIQPLSDAPDVELFDVALLLLRLDSVRDEVLANVLDRISTATFAMLDASELDLHFRQQRKEQTSASDAAHAADVHRPIVERQHCERANQTSVHVALSRDVEVFRRYVNVTVVQNLFRHLDVEETLRTLPVRTTVNLGVDQVSDAQRNAAVSNFVRHVTSLVKPYYSIQPQSSPSSVKPTPRQSMQIGPSVFVLMSTSVRSDPSSFTVNTKPP